MVLTKYKERIKDLDVEIFMPLLRERVDEIKSNKFPYIDNNQLDDLLDGILDEDLNLI